MNFILLGYLATTAYPVGTDTNVYYYALVPSATTPTNTGRFFFFF